MTVHLKIDGRLLDTVRQDLHRPHPFAYERVGFFTAGVADLGDRLLLLVRDYTPVADADYEIDRKVGAKIGSAAMRKAVQSAYRPAATLLHVHTHGGQGKPGFSGVTWTAPSPSSRASSRPHRACRTVCWCSVTTQPTASCGSPATGRR